MFCQQKQVFSISSLLPLIFERSRRSRVQSKLRWTTGPCKRSLGWSSRMIVGQQHNDSLQWKTWAENRLWRCCRRVQSCMGVLDVFWISDLNQCFFTLCYSGYSESCILAYKPLITIMPLGCYQTVLLKFLSKSPEATLTFCKPKVLAQFGSRNLGSLGESSDGRRNDKSWATAMDGIQSNQVRPRLYCA